MDSVNNVKDIMDFSHKESGSFGRAETYYESNSGKKQLGFLST